VPFWELPQVPDSWLGCLSAVDVVLAPSLFVAEAIRSKLPAARIIHFRQAVYPPAQLPAIDAPWADDQSGLTFLCAFDLHSDMERKNPWAVVEAFQLAFADWDGARLVIKVNGADMEGHADDLRLLRELAEADNRIVIITESYSRDAMWSLYNSADVYVSLHRSEGLGLGPLESMALGKPVVATGWSGNMDFMTDDNSFPIPFELVPVAGTRIGAYEHEESGQRWAQPDVSAAARAMRALADDDGLRARVGHSARETVRRLQAGHSEAFVQLGELASVGIDRSAEQRLELRSLIHTESDTSLTMEVKRAVVSGLRAARLRPPAPEGEIRTQLSHESPLLPRRDEGSGR
jgi:glycosyltransferase involved in cell wall biosynthesis